jgi:hypothetical protein
VHTETYKVLGGLHRQEQVAKPEECAGRKSTLQTVVGD